MKKDKQLPNSKNIDICDDSNAKKNISSKTKLGIVWTVLSNGCQFIFHFAGSIILARILFPEDFGLMAIVSIVLQFAHRLTNFGFVMVLVQRKEIKSEHLNTVFLTNLFLAGILTVSLYSAAPKIAVFFENEAIENIVRVIGFNFILQALSSLPRAILRRKMMFRQLEISNTISALIGLIASVCFAIAGFGVWSLVLGTLLSSLNSIITLTYFSGWFPCLKFKFSALREVFSFGLWVYIASYVNFGINKVDFFIVGKILNVTQLGLYERAFNLMSLPRKKIAQQIGRVMFSTYSRIQDEEERTVKILSRLLLYLSIILYPLMIWMFFAAPSLIKVLYGEKWISSIYPFQIMCLAGIMDTLTLILDPVNTARGLIGNRTRRDFIYLIILCFSVFFGTKWGINGVAWGTMIASFLRFGMMLNLTIKNLPITIRTFIAVQRSAILYSLILISILWPILYMLNSHISKFSYIMLIITTLLTAIILILTHLILRLKDVEELIYSIMQKLYRFNLKAALSEQK